MINSDLQGRIRVQAAPGELRRSGPPHWEYAHLTANRDFPNRDGAPNALATSPRRRLVQDFTTRSADCATPLALMGAAKRFWDGLP